jgi:putative hemolysin
LLSVLQIRPSADGKITEEELKIIKEGTEGGEVQEIEQDIVERVFILETENQLMTHRKSVVFLEVGANKDAVKESMLEELHSIYQCTTKTMMIL